MAAELYLGGNAADGTPIAALKTVLINPATGLPFSPNGNGEQIIQLKDSIPVTATGAAGAAVTLSTPTPAAGKFIYLAYLQIVLYASVAMVGAAAPIVVATTNLPNSPAFSFPTALAQGTMVEEKMEGVALIKASTAATAVTIVAPIATNGIWRINATYFVA